MRVALGTAAAVVAFDQWTKWLVELHLPNHAAHPLIPGFLAGDWTLKGMSAGLRARGFRTYRSQIKMNVGCTMNSALMLERRLEEIAERRDSRVEIVGHSLGGMIARGLAVRRPDLISGIVTMGSPMRAPAASRPCRSASSQSRCSVLPIPNSCERPWVMTRRTIGDLPHAGERIACQVM